MALRVNRECPHGAHGLRKGIGRNHFGPFPVGRGPAKVPIGKEQLLLRAGGIHVHGRSYPICLYAVGEVILKFEPPFQQVVALGTDVQVLQGGVEIHGAFPFRRIVFWIHG